MAMSLTDDDKAWIRELFDQTGLRIETQFSQSDRRFERIERYLERGARTLALERGYRLETDRRISALVQAQLESEEKIGLLGDRVADLAEVHRQTEVSLKALIDSLRKPGNGNLQ